MVITLQLMELLEEIVFLLRLIDLETALALLDQLVHQVFMGIPVVMVTALFLAGL